MFSLTFLDVRLANLTNQRDIGKHPLFLWNRAKHDEIQEDFDEIRSVYLLSAVGDFICEADFIHDSGFIPSQDGFRWKKRDFRIEISLFSGGVGGICPSGQLQSTFHTSHAKARSYSMGEAHYIAILYVFNMDFCSNSSLKCSPMQQALVPLLSSLETKNPILKIFQTKTI